MGHQVLARKWRPILFNDVLSQPHIVRSIVGAIKNDKIGHAYLFTGTRGVGKTTIARIFAKAIRCSGEVVDGNPCLKCSNCLEWEKGESLDVHELDGASNNSVENVRQLIDNVQYLPANGKYKVYIIDEVHMLSTSAFNALLKTLEEPPAHVVFILATTDPEKIPGTVLSRCQRYDFRTVSDKEIAEHLKNIVAKEGLSFEKDEMVNKLARLSRGSFRDSLSLLDQVLSYVIEDKITEEEFYGALGLAKFSNVKDLVEGLLAGDWKSCKKTFDQILGENIILEKLTHSILEHIYSIIQNIDNKRLSEYISDDISKTLSYDELFWVYETITKESEWTLKSLLPKESFEILLMKISMRREFFADGDVKINNKIESEGSSSDSSEEAEQEIVAAPSEPVQVAPVQEKNFNENKTWNEYVNYLLESRPVLGTNLEQGNIAEDFDTTADNIGLKIGFKRAGKIFKDYLDEPKNKEKIVETFKEFFSVPNANVSVEVILVEAEIKKETFYTKVDIEEEKEKIDSINRKEEFLHSSIVKSAEKLFNGQVDKVILNERELR